jgi:hypothetical protein
MFMSTAKTASEFRDDVVMEITWRSDRALRQLNFLANTKGARRKRIIEAECRLHVLREMLDFYKDIVVDGKRWTAPEVTSNNTEKTDA